MSFTNKAGHNSTNGDHRVLTDALTSKVSDAACRFAWSILMLLSGAVTLVSMFRFWNIGALIPAWSLISVRLAYSCLVLVAFQTLCALNCQIASGCIKQRQDRRLKATSTEAIEAEMNAATTGSSSCLQSLSNSYSCFINQLVIKAHAHNSINIPMFLRPYGRMVVEVTGWWSLGDKVSSTLSVDPNSPHQSPPHRTPTICINLL